MRRPVVRPLLPQLGRWLPVPATDSMARDLYLRHRSSWLGVTGHIKRPSYNDLTLITPQGDAICAWAPQSNMYAFPGLRLVVLHNESSRRLYTLLGEASEIAAATWPDRTQYVLLDRRSQATRAKTLRKAGWNEIGAEYGSRIWRRERGR